MQPDDAGLEMARIKALQDNAKRLGLTWQLRPATVQPGENTTDSASIVYDGDTEAIQAVSMVGRLFGGQRVYAIASPEAANHIVGGVASATTPYRDRIVTTGTATASVTFTGIPANLRSLTLHSTARFNANGAALLYAQVNGDTAAANYFSHYYGATDVAYITPVQLTGVAGIVAGLVAGNNTAGDYASSVMTITNWDQAVSPWNLVSVFQATSLQVGVGYFSRAGGGIYLPASPYTTLTLLSSTGSFEAGSIFDLIGNPA